MSKSIQLKNIDKEKIYPHPYYPVGSIYLSVNNTDPSKWFGGTWNLIAQGRTLVGVDTNDTDFNTVKKIGGEKKHVLTITETPKHNHPTTSPDFNFTIMKSISGSSGKLTVGSNGRYGFASNNGYNDLALANVTGITGGSQAHNNLQPYFTCYIWCRIA